MLQSRKLKTSPSFPAEVRAEVAGALGGEPVTEDFAWMSWAGTVWRVTGPRGQVFVRRAAHLQAERQRLEWLSGRWPVPEVIGLFEGLGDEWLVTRAISGVPMYDSSVGWPPDRVAVEFGEFLKTLHATDADDCPFGVKKRGHVLIHGDYCLPNVLVDEGKPSAVIDVGLSGLGNPETDLAAGVWTLQYNYGKGFARVFLAAYGWPPMSDEAIERLRRRYAR